MSQPPSPPKSGATARVRISCPGCGRHDYVAWPAGQPTYAWTCFNCGKSFELARGPKH